MKITFDRSFYIPKGAERISVPDGVVAECWLSPLGDKWHLVAFGGKRNKPDANYTFRSREKALQYAAEYFDGQRQTQAMRQEWKEKRLADRCSTPLECWEKAKKGDYLTCADVAVCLRAELARAFPGVRFSVRSDGSLNVNWTDGPTTREVKRVADCYSFEGFDGMIDMRYSINRWLSRDGKMSLAHSTGTEGSMGSDPEVIGSPHAADCVQVRATCDFVFCNRKISYSVKLGLAKVVCREWGITLPENLDTHGLELFLNTTTNGHGDYLSCLVHRESCNERERI